MNELVGLTARQAVELLRKGQVSPLELLDAAIERIEETDPAINALPTVCADRARAHAARLTPPRADETPPGYLHGLPIVVKDLKDVEGVRSTMGSPIYADRVPGRSDYLVRVIEAKGGIVLAKSNTPEFGAGGNTFNEVFGKTRNPWDTATTCGGSSGGSAAALAAGQVWLATGSDLGGSLRLPASFCSVVGLRPTPGRVAHGPKQLPFGTLSVEGPMGRNVGDVALFLDTQAGQHAGDPISLVAPTTPYVEAVEAPVSPKRVAYSPDLGIAPAVDSDVARVCAEAALRLEEAGCKVEEACIDLGDAEETFQTLRAVQFAATYGPLLRDQRELLKPEMVWNIEKGLALTADEIGKAERARGEIAGRTAKFFETYDALLVPAVVAPPFDVDVRYLTEVEGVPFDTYLGWLVLTFALTLTACPVISVPCGFTGSGLPVGLQIMTPWADEASALSIGAQLEGMVGVADLVPIDPRPSGVGRES